MRPGKRTLKGAILLAPAIAMVTWGGGPTRGDEPGRLGRLFRFGGGGGGGGGDAPASRPSTPPSAATPALPSPGLPGDQPRNASPLLFDTGAGAPVASSTSPTTSPRITPRPRVSRPATEADPLATRVSIGRSDDGNQFGMFLQVFADGTVIDSEGTHHVSPDALKPLVDAIGSSDLSRVKGHCGAPSTDFIEEVHMVVYERNLGRLRATAFSYSGNPQGCDHAVRHLHTALDALQAKVSRAPAPATTAAAAPLGAAPAAPEPIGGTGRRIPLTTINP